MPEVFVTPTATPEPENLLRYPVQGEYMPIHSKRPTITGGMPKDWYEDSSWADVTVNYRAQTQNPHEGDRSLRVEVKKIVTGQVQWKVNKIPMTPEQIYRVRIPLRSEENRPVTVTLRKQAPPYTSYWSQTLQTMPEWGVKEAMILSKHTDPDAGLYFSMQGPGTLELGEVTLEPLSLKQALAGGDFEGNLLYSSSFPLGLTAPWASGANGTEPHHLRADPENPGPSGLPALRLEPHRYEERPMIQITSPFIGMPGEKHTFSVWAKAEKPGMTVNLRMGAPSEQIYKAPWQKILHLSTEWKRYSMTVELPPAPGFLYLARVTSHDDGVFWMDQAMVEVGENATAFQPATPVELYIKADRDLGLSLEGEDMPVTMAISKALPEDARIRFTFLDLADNEIYLDPLPVKKGETEFSLRIPAPQTYGSFLLMAQLEDAKGAPKGKPAEVLLHHVRTPRHLNEFAPNSAFGTHFPETPELLGIQKRLGFNWNRPHYRNKWSTYQQKDGSWDFRRLDRQLKLHEEAKLLHVINFGGVPEEFSVVDEGFSTGNGWYKTTAAPRRDAMEAWQDYCRRVLAHAGDRLPAVEIWNEPFLPGFFVGEVVEGRPKREEPEVMAEMMKRARQAARDAKYPGRLIWNTGPHYGSSELGFTRGVLAAGGAEQVDNISFHRYVSSPLGFPGDQFDQDLQVIRREFTDKAAASEIWNSEGGQASSSVFNLYQTLPPFEHREKAAGQAVHAVRYYLSNFAAGADKVFLYTLQPMDGWKADYSYMTVDGKLSSVAPALSNLAWHLEDLAYVETVSRGEDLLVQKYTGEDRTVWVLVPQGGKAPKLDWMPENAVLTNLWGNTVAPSDIRYPGIWYFNAAELPEAP
jgi:hypothetical protein